MKLLKHSIYVFAFVTGTLLAADRERVAPIIDNTD